MMARMAHKKISTETKVRRSSARWVHRVTRNTAIILIGAAASLIVGLAVSLSLRNMQWFARSGAIVSTLGVLLVSQAGLLAESVRSHAIHPRSGRAQTDPEHYEEIGAKVPEWVEKDVQTRYAVAVLGPTLSAVGSLVWAFADLIALH